MRFRLSAVICIAYIVILSFSAKAQVYVNSVTSTSSTCPNNGTITIDAGSPSPPVLYSIVSGPVTQQAQTNPVFTSLPSGNYTVKISDGAGNEALENSTIGGNYVNPSFSVVPASPYCEGGNDGALNAAMVGNAGLAPFSWELVSPSPVITGPQSSSEFQGLTAGNYTVRTTDACGSVSTQVVTVSPPDTDMEIYNMQLLKTGCDTLTVYFQLDVDFKLRMPLEFQYETSNGTFIPASGTTIDSSMMHLSGSVLIYQLIPGLTYGDYVKVTVTNSCGNSISSNLLSAHPFNFYPHYTFNQCGNEVTIRFDNTPPGALPHTSLKNPVSYSLTNLADNSTVESGISTYNSGAIIYTPVLSGETYRFTLTDGCGEVFTHDYLIPFKAPPVVIDEIWSGHACIDSVVGLFRVRTAGMGSNSKLILLSGPETLGSTGQGFEYSDTYSYPDTVPYHPNAGTNVFFISNLAAGTYTYKVIDACGNELFDSFTITPQQVTGLSRNVSSEKGCPGKNKIFYGMQAGGTATVKRLPDNTELKTTTFWQLGGANNTDSVLNVPSGSYEITFDYEIANQVINPVNDHYTGCWKVIDTIVIPPYSNPEISAGNAILCNEQLHIELIPDTTRGVPPFQYEISSGPQTFPLQHSNLFTVDLSGTYYARIFDACNNATVKQVTVDTLSFDPVGVTTTCSNTRLGFPPSIYYTYEWRKPDGQFYTGDSLILNPVTPADTGMYEIFKIVHVNGCIDTFTTTFHVDLPNYTEQHRSLCEGEAITVGGNVYSVPGIYTDTLISSSGCDSLVVTTFTWLSQLADTTVVLLCNGDSVLISDNYLSVPGFYTDSIQNMYGCYDLQVTELVIVGEEPFHQYVTLCSDGSYLLGNNSYTTTGTYYDTLSSAQGCDSIIVLHLDVLPEITYILNETICEGESYAFSGNMISAAGSYADTLLSAYSCDSIVLLHLTVLPVKEYAFTVSLCEGETFYFGGQERMIEGIYKDTIPTLACDSIVTLHLTILPAVHHSIYDTICEGTEYVWAGGNYTHSGTYTHSFSTSSCDSSVTLNLTVVPRPSVSVTSTVTESGEASAIVQLNAVSVSSPLSYWWESDADISNHTVRNPTISIRESTWITLTVTDQYGCTATVDYYVGFPETSTLYLPNAVTPDGNEFNNVFRAYGTNISTFHILIFDRWGEVIFESYDFNFSWDATYRGKIVQDGVYTYKLAATGIDGVYYNMVGHVTVIR